MDCQRVRIELAELVAGQVAAAQAMRIQAHVAGCPGCARALAREEALRSLVQDALQAPEPSYSFAELKRKMHLREPMERVLVILPKLRHIGVMPSYAVALALLVCFGGIGYAARFSRDLYGACKNPIEAQRAFVSKEFPEIYDTIYVTPEKRG